jgi:hypothetical protein
LACQDVRRVATQKKWAILKKVNPAADVRVWGMKSSVLAIAERGHAAAQDEPSPHTFDAEALGLFIKTVREAQGKNLAGVAPEADVNRRRCTTSSADRRRSTVFSTWRVRSWSVLSSSSNRGTRQIPADSCRRGFSFRQRSSLTGFQHHAGHLLHQLDGDRRGLIADVAVRIVFNEITGDDRLVDGMNEIDDLARRRATGFAM